ncbi:hypothetical protein BDV32DRAFT_153158 [Aspergillus pseudonomiae]|uniref:Uncharacterized protein n=1 Tax=Aspergillus pseudonomiae TaxID=1506151 RepID=A0A5N6HQ38_9EURO|nr:uncharacterized protein BDV37DRAFT_286825 [Aspergillus pseudonomiae]KAB8256536.1 hypothetical protein BDV32DRAFT_153158 [Aspergillus pseudonomiae]KAE8400193.1 hypothetical protein BDV37DRAFT_286825 [Aspergillus pseudonomiae]
MVFPGRRSTGCYVCRERKVKCDGARPACARCTKFGRKCIGYPDSFKFRFYDSTSFQNEASTPLRPGHVRETPATAQEGKRRDPSVVTVQATGHDHRKSPLKLQSPSVPQCLSIASWELWPLSYFFHQHVLIVHRSPCGGHLAFLPDLYREKGSEPCLKHAVLSVAYLTLFNSNRSPLLWTQARTNYSTALVALAASLNTPESAARDEVFAACLLLSMFIDLSNERKNSLNAHIPGIHALMQLRGVTSLRGKYGRVLFAWAFMQSQIQAIASNDFGYGCLPAALSTMENSDSVCRAGIVISMISKFCASVRYFKKYMQFQFRSGHAPTTEPSFELLEQAGSIMSQIDSWHARLPRHWKAKLKDATPGGLSGERISASEDSWTTCFVAIISTTHLFFYLQFLEYCECVSPNLEALKALPNENSIYYPLYGIGGRIQDSINVICLSVSYALGSMNVHGRFEPFHNTKQGIGYNLLWPMSLVATCQFSTTEQARLCQQALEYTWSTMGRVDR